MRLYKVLLIAGLVMEFVGSILPHSFWAGSWFVAGGAVVAGFGILFLPPRHPTPDEPDPGPAVPDLRHFLKRFDEWCLVAPPLTTEIQEGRWIRLVGAVNFLRGVATGDPSADASAESAPVKCEGCGAPAPGGPLPRNAAERDEQMAETLRFALTGRCRSCAAKEGVRDARG